MTYLEYRKHDRFEWARPAILFAILAFSLTTPAVYLGDHRDVISLDCEVKMGYNKDRLQNLWGRCGYELYADAQKHPGHRS